MEFTEEKLLARYKELVAKRDAVYEKQKPLKEQLNQINVEIDAKRKQAEEIVKEIDKDWGPSWLALKKEIALLARNLGRPNGPLAKKD